MKNTEIIKNALLIAEFEGYETYYENGYDQIRYNSDNERTAQDTGYHEDWNWLMPVVEKINIIDDYRFTVTIKSMDVEVFDNLYIRTLLECESEPDKLIKAVYQAVIEFIKWYNENNSIK